MRVGGRGWQKKKVEVQERKESVSLSTGNITSKATDVVICKGKPQITAGCCFKCHCTVNLFVEIVCSWIWISPVSQGVWTWGFSLGPFLFISLFKQTQMESFKLLWPCDFLPFLFQEIVQTNRGQLNTLTGLTLRRAMRVWLKTWWSGSVASPFHYCYSGSPWNFLSMFRDIRSSSGSLYYPEPVISLEAEWTNALTSQLVV